MPTDPSISIVEATAAAIVTYDKLSEKLKDQFDGSQKFVVHPYLSAIASDNALLGGYLKNIYTTEKSIGVTYPTSPAFRQLSSAATLEVGTGALAAQLAETMSKKNANPGILFGFRIVIDGSVTAHGVIKADFDDEARFHFNSGSDGAWSLSEVADVLPPPRTIYAKYAIAPRPLGDEAAGVHDVTDSASAADYFLQSIALVVPRTKGTRALVAQAAVDSNYSIGQIKVALAAVKETKPLDDVIEEHFPRIPPARREKLKGSVTRPVASVLADDPYMTTYSTKNPRFELTVDENVQVTIEGRTVTVNLPADSDDIAIRTR